MVLNATSFLQASKIRLDQLQQQLARRDIDLLEAKAQCLKLQEDLTVKCGEMTAEKLEQAALQRAHHASEKASIDCTQTPLCPYMLHPPPPAPAFPLFPTPSTLAVWC